MKCSRNSPYNAIGEEHKQCIIALSIKSASTTNIKKRQEKRFNKNSVFRFIYIIHCTYCIIYNALIIYSHMENISIYYQVIQENNSLLSATPS
jgi:hypothetical protein